MSPFNLCMFLTTLFISGLFLCVVIIIFFEINNYQSAPEFFSIQNIDDDFIGFFEYGSLNITCLIKNNDEFVDSNSSIFFNDNTYQCCTKDWKDSLLVFIYCGFPMACFGILSSFAQYCIIEISQVK